MKKGIALASIIGLLALALYFASPQNESTVKKTRGTSSPSGESSSGASIFQLLPDAESKILESMSHAHARLVSKMMGTLLEVRGYTNEGGKVREIKSPAIMILPQRYIVAPSLNYSKVQHVVVVFDNVSYPVTFWAQDVESGITIFKADAKNLPGVEIAPSSALGEFVILCRYDQLLKALGISSGIVSRAAWAPIRPGYYEIPMLAVEIPRPRDTTAGFLFNLRSQLVGIEEIVAGPHASGNVSYVMSNQHLLWLMRSLEQHGHVVRGSIGADFQDADGELAMALGVKHRTGALISGITQNSVASRVGLKEGDVVVSVTGVEVKNAQSLRQIIGQIAPGTEIEIKVARENGVVAVRLTTEEATPPPVEAPEFRKLPR